MHQTKLFTSEAGQPSVEIVRGGVTGNHNLFEQVISLENLFLAWEMFRKGKMGKKDVLRFFMQLEDQLFALHDDLVAGTYRHGSYEQFYVHDPKRRYISKASVRDRVVHQVVVQIIEPIFERRFIFDSYSSRKGKGTHAAVDRLRKFLCKASKNFQRPVFGLKCDIRKFFNSIHHDILLKILSHTIQDTDLHILLQEIVGSYGASDVPACGLPLGNVTSQLFANVYLDRFDHYVKEDLRMRWYLRFSDDFIIVHSERSVLEELLPELHAYLRCELKLTLHPQKIVIRKYSQGVDFVGQILMPHYRVLRKSTKLRMFKHAERLWHQYRQGLISDITFRQSLQSYFGLLKHGANYGARENLHALFLKYIQSSP